MSRTAPRGFRDRLPWYLVAAVFALFAALVGASLANYMAVADAQVRTALHPSYSVAYPPGTGPVAFTLHLFVENPSSRRLFFNTIGYKVWIEDLPAEAGFGGPVRGDVAGPNGTPYYPVFAGSVQVAAYPVPAGQNATYLYTLNLTAGNNPSAYGVVANITAFATAHGVDPASIRWIFWTLVSLDIEGVPPPSAYSAADYLLNLGRVALTGGEDLGA